MAMITMCQLWNDFKGRENTWQGGHVRPKSFEAWVHESQIEIQNELVKALGNNQTLTDNLRPFLKSTQIPISLFASGGIVKYPKDYRRFSSLRFFSKSATGTSGGVLVTCIDLMDTDGNCKPLTEEEKAEALTQENACEKIIEKVDNQFWGGVCDDSIAPPSLSTPFSTQLDQGFKVLPKALGYVVLDYISIPVRPVFNFTRDARHNVTCLPSSTTLAWGEEMIPELLARIKKRYGGFTRNQESYQQGEQERQITTS